MDREGVLTKKATSSPLVEDRFVLENSGHWVSFFFFNGYLFVLFFFLFFFVKVRSRGEGIRLFLIRFCKLLRDFLIRPSFVSLFFCLEGKRDMRK